MALEIERKFLLKNDHWKDEFEQCNNSRCCDYSQGYLTQSESKSSIRIRTSSDKAWLNIKSAEMGMSRTEFEYEIPLEDAQEMLNSLCFTPIIVKKRYYIPYHQHIWEVDVFAGENTGLVVAEIELSDCDEQFDKPDWIGCEVTNDHRYYNVSLVKHPYSEWNNA